MPTPAVIDPTVCICGRRCADGGSACGLAVCARSLASLRDLGELVAVADAELWMLDELGERPLLH